MFAGIPRADYPRWVRDGLLTPCSESGCTEEDVRELAALAQVLKDLSVDDGRVAWRQVRVDARRQLKPGGRLDLVYAERRARAALVENDIELASAVRVDSTVRVVRLSESADEAAESMQRWLAAQPPQQIEPRNIVHIRPAAERGRQ